MTQPATWRWTPKRRKAAELIAQGDLTQVEVGRECGVSDRMIRHWRKAPEFMNYVHELEEATRAEAKSYLGRHALSAARRLVELSEQGMPEDKVRLAATVAVLDRAGVIAAKGIEVGTKGQAIVAILPAIAEGSESAAAVDSTRGAAAPVS